MPGYEEIATQLVQEFDLHPVIGLEIEWYVRPKGYATSYEIGAQERDGYLDALCVAADASGIAVDAFDEEHGPGQFEASLSHTRDISLLLRHMGRLREVVTDTGFRKGFVTDFSAKPYPEIYGNGLHIHVHLENSSGENVFRKTQQELSPQLEACLAGLLSDLPRSVKIFIPTEESRARIEPGWHAPVKACWGTNNRTTAVRLPDNSARIKGAEALARIKNPDQRRIEHRVAGSDADASAVISAVLEGMLLGLRERPPLSPPVYGDAGHTQYAYPLIREMIA